MERPTHEVPDNEPDEFPLEHHSGRRWRCKARVRLSTGTGITGSGRIRDISSSGAFIETKARLLTDIQVELMVIGNESAVHVVEVTANVVRVEPDGIAVTWSKPPTCAICTAMGCTVLCANVIQPE